MSREETIKHAVEAEIEAHGVHGVHVDVEPGDVVYLDGEVGTVEEEAIAVQAAIDIGADRVEDGLHYPHQEDTHGHLAEHHSAVKHDSSIHVQAATPEEKILRGAHLDTRLFDSNAYPPLVTGNAIVTGGPSE